VRAGLVLSLLQAARATVVTTDRRRAIEIQDMNERAP
jgi:hypothetical protein